MPISSTLWMATLLLAYVTILAMHVEDKTFNLRFSLEANFPEDYDGEEDERAWLREWEQRIKPQLMKAVFTSLREHPEWTARIRNRGMSQDDEIEIALTKNF